ncbi:alpha-L-arabinofuranosidase C-terminal domain-containing protein [Plantibacter sp. RU18]|uniref:alpha-L-arabinofuranosidase C-terminal domain-containing protein n=1 Tax=Plantibacter sp. RU18 TaxID=3158143 RepID=UPI002CA750AA|nr:alpha-L-arabinofuranosidase C-terminal domain-containing protein [Gemmatimonadaceae bacterium]
MTEPFATVTIGSDEPGQLISPLIFGGMIEHFGRTVDPGIWDAEHDIPRSDTKAAIEAMGVRALRYPGGCFSDDYHWRDGVGPKSERPLVEETFWTTVTQRLGGFGTNSTFASTPEDIGRLIGPPEPNLLGTDEFLQYCLDVDAEPFLVVNMGTGTPEEAADWVRYCNVDRRSPRPVTWWSLGNEAWGIQEYAHAEPTVYGRRVVEFARAMRAVDPDIKFVAVGLPVNNTHESMPAGMAPYPAKVWNAGVLQECKDDIDLLSVHWYFPGMIERPLRTTGDLRQLSTSPQLLEDAFATTIGFVDDLTGPDRRIDISFDEWNRMVQFDDHLATNHPLGNAAFFAGCYNAILAHADRIPMAFISHLVNCLAPIQTDDKRLFVTVSFLVARLYSHHARGRSLSTRVESPSMHVQPFEGLDPAAMSGSILIEPREARVITAAATREGDRSAVFLVNADPEAAHDVEVISWADGPAKVQWIAGPDVWAQNDFDHPDVLQLREKVVHVDDGRLVVTVPPAGVAVVSR